MWRFLLESKQMQGFSVLIGMESPAFIWVLGVHSGPVKSLRILPTSLCLHHKPTCWVLHLGCKGTRQSYTLQSLTHKKAQRTTCSSDRNIKPSDAYKPLLRFVYPSSPNHLCSGPHGSSQPHSYRYSWNSVWISGSATGLKWFLLLPKCHMVFSGHLHR